MVKGDLKDFLRKCRPDDNPQEEIGEADLERFIYEISEVSSCVKAGEAPAVRGPSSW